LTKMGAAPDDIVPHFSTGWDRAAIGLEFTTEDTGITE